MLRIPEKARIQGFKKKVRHKTDWHEKECSGPMLTKRIPWFFGIEMEELEESLETIYSIFPLRDEILGDARS